MSIELDCYFIKKYILCVPLPEAFSTGIGYTQSPGLVNFVIAVAHHFWPGFACSTHTTWGPPFRAEPCTCTLLQGEGSTWGIPS